MTDESSPILLGAHAGAVSSEEAEIPRGALADSDSVRVDTWLWAVRRVKSRSQATSAARAGHVKVNGDTAKAAQKVRIGDEVRLRVEGFDQVLRVRRLLVKRVGAPQARMAYEDLTPERPRMVIPIARRERGTGRPSKRERRDLDRLRGRDSHVRARLDRSASEDPLDAER
ncbi:MAG: RNA-binding S4 domain-containing protein [Schaalia hyovaginalis]|uniref:RNA-binding S4 domain-containing protein n=1 Tax=Schaalia hyovaginalis TaxID=29316 RepID=UPI0026F32962|nr:RNA-binding S4 domain-containing protein [Schaalia hyovaginalis]MCI6410345.1 RNA-binding S4 domain-containing protein [Schaalia hyovaginalis]MCI7513799.1 RNA-binding S4 domain-containing protein [Schaalia hyovaginalis]MDY3664764.1 RNA-binding S4 domain-containing protein [Schaalia hyovaginalis]MDY4262966.1 RNA-binding S4 domain-containing protein [Schaalia hyovaginalis]MDY5601448.1 RNA-binding S4 domain-containing protein [Schaalia hyovaginalis]